MRRRRKEKIGRVKWEGKEGTHFPGVLCLANYDALTRLLGLEGMEEGRRARIRNQKKI